LIEELRHLGALGVHDAVEAEVQIGLVELEQLLQQGLQLLVFLAHGRSRSSFVMFDCHPLLDGPADGE
jgi:hypothetical protein